MQGENGKMKSDLEQTEIEAPYELPEGWKWIPLLKSFENKTSSNKKLPTKDYSDAGKYAIIDQGQEFIGGYSDKTDFVFDGELPIIVFGDHTKCIKYIDFPFIQGADGVKILKPISIVDSKYFYYALQNIHFPDLGYRRHFPIFKDYQFPLPPTLAEQQRIVNRIESMFAKLDEAKEKAQNVVDGFETRKAAILHKAFIGELTAKWRKENGVSDDSWEEKTIGECGSVYGGGTPSTSHKDYWENGNILWITSKDMKNDIIEDSEMHVNMKGIENSSAKFIEKPALLFVMRSGILRRTFPICMVKKEFTVNQDLKALVPYGCVLLEYLFYVCKSNEREILNTCMKNGTTVESINAKALFDFVIFVPTFPEQVEIVRILDIIIEKENKAKQAAEAVLEQIDLLKKSILARAFRGEL